MVAVVVGAGLVTDVGTAPPAGAEVVEVVVSVVATFDLGGTEVVDDTAAIAIVDVVVVCGPAVFWRARPKRNAQTAIVTMSAEINRVATAWSTALRRRRGGTAGVSPVRSLMTGVSPVGSSQLATAGRYPHHGRANRHRSGPADAEVVAVQLSRPAAIMQRCSAMSIAERMGRLSNKLYDRMRSKAAFTISADAAVERDFEPLRGHKYATLVTFRKSGEAMPSPVWFGLDSEGRAYLHTMHDSGKVKRIRNNSKALIVASTTRGKPTGPVLAGAARVLPEDEWPHAEAALAAAYGTGRKIYQRVLGDAEGIGTYIEITPVASAST